MTLTARQLDGLCSQSYLVGLDSAPLAELRARRDESQHAEVVLSYLRRVIQGEIDLVLAEMEVRRLGGQSDPERLVEDLPSILASSAASSSQPHHLPALTMAAVAEVMELQRGTSIDELLAELSSVPDRGVVAPEELLNGANLCTFGEHELQQALERLRRHEGELSAKRRVLHEHIDAIQAAIVDRYKSGAADPDSLLS